MIPVDLIIFDLDGTLIDSKKDIATAVNLTLTDMGMATLNEQVIYGYVGEGVRRLLKQSVGIENHSRCTEALKIFRQHYLEHLLDTTRFHPGIDGVLAHFSHKPKAIVTNKPTDYTMAILEGLAVVDQFEMVIGSEGTQELKPHPAMILKAVEGFKVDRSKAVMVGDSVLDVQAAQAAGTKSCAVGYGMGVRSQLEASRPNFFCEYAKELTTLFQ
ncbi:MAG: HAD family hydrolase [Nitrospiraceae bacterium]|jgi:phosphoglycolate phosphatase|nr:HAD family hydrolase [Nitrospiraceae bacterium]|tara:strand:- start:1750 stop:2394 length:645 start_codon:yes stop_codon:yes gene_type:complete